MAITGVEYFSGGLFSSSTGTAARYFSEGFFLGAGAAGLVPALVDGMFATVATEFDAVRLFSFGVFTEVVAGAEEGAENIWNFILTAKKRQDQFLPL